MDNLATLEDLQTLFRPLKAGEAERAGALLQTVSAMLRSEAKKRGYDLPAMLSEDEDLEAVAKSVVCDIVGRALMTSTDMEPMQQYSESALGYSQSGTFLVPGGGIFIKESEYLRLGLRVKQRYGALEVFGV